MVIITESELNTENGFNVCQNCILTDGFFNLRINSEGLCDFCADPAHINPNWKKVQINDSLRKEKQDDWNKVITNLQEKFGDSEYCCVLGFSGGKDSTALVDTFVNEYHLKPFLVTIDTGYMTDVAMNNIKQTLKKMNLEDDHVFINSAIPIFTSLYKYLFFNHDSNEKGLTLEICHICTDILHTILVKESINRGLDYVMIAFSPDQIARYFYETSQKDTFEDGLPRPPEFKELLEENELEWFLTEDILIEELPRVLYPYHVIEYDEKEVISRIESKGLIDKGKGNPVVTNCHVVKVALMYDLYRYGGITYALQYAELVRQKTTKEERIKARKELLIVLLLFSRTIFRGTLNVEGFNRFFKRIGTTKEELLKAIEFQRQKDPNNLIILKNLELIKKMQLK